MRLRRTLPFLLLAALVAPVHAQIAFGGQPYGPKASKLGLSDVPTFQLPPIDVAAYLAQDSADIAQRVPKPFRFGAPVATDLGLTNSGTWDQLPNGDRVWRLRLRSPGALSLTLILDQYVIPAGARMFVYDRKGNVAGAFTAESNPGHTSIGLFPFASEELTVEYIEPSSVAGQGSLHIGQVTHGYRDILGDAQKGLGDSGPCNVNVICPEGDDWRDQIRSVAMIVVGGSGACTGQLINNCNEDGTPYFLTANHCLGGSVANWSFRFNWDSPTCTPTTNGPTNQTVSGATLLASSAGSDVALLELSSTPPTSYNVFYSGWDATGDQPTDQTCIHHPRGDIKKISHEADDADQQVWGTPSAQVWHIPSWDSGTTEPGSSGSGLWDQNGRLIGQLYGGQANCGFNFNDYYGRFDVSYPLLQQWLGVSCGLAIDGYDPNAAPLQPWDAGISSITQVPDQVCDQNIITPEVTIKNYGTNAFNTVTVTYEINGAAPVDLTFNGTLSPNQTANYLLPPIPVNNGVNTLVVYTSGPNGQADGNTANDDRTKAFNVSSPGEVITVQIRLDDWGSETTWELRPQGSTTVITQGGPYSDNSNGSVESKTACLGSGCYTLVVEDAFGDGICCGQGNGDFWVLSSTGDTLANGDGDFNSSTNVSFCLENVGVGELSAGNDMHIWPNPGSGLFDLRFDRALETTTVLTVRDALGRAVRTFTLATGTARTTLGLTDLAAGTYLLEAGNGNARLVRRLVVTK